MHEAKHLAAVIHLGTFVLKAPAQHHVAVEQQALLGAHLGRGGGIEVAQPFGMGTGRLVGVGGTGGGSGGCRKLTTHVCLGHPLIA